ncbi:MAG TPA: D-alanyl-D-alanine carboxypeptidase/D-alanyl-D-alanine-endopeptidase [Polyangiaceae bacterium]|nr:D-alanyl-D-alanine carboxypeptidase/D-alanyl-D-alanine-endopeptidase [Polyangiaceae bacterium]
MKIRSIRLSYPCALLATVLIVGGAPPASTGLTGCAAPPPRSPVSEADSSRPPLAASVAASSTAPSAVTSAAPGVAVAPSAALAPEAMHPPEGELPSQPQVPPAQPALPSTPPHVWKGGEFQRAVTQLARWVKNSGGSLAAELSDVASAAVLGSHSPNSPENPASNQKILTAAAVLRHFGADHRFRTWLCGSRNGASIPRLVVRGSGDPSLSSSDLQLMVKALAKAGVRQVAEVLVDQSFFDRSFVPPAFEQQPEEWAAFRAPVSAVSLNRNVTTLNVKPGEAGQPATVWFDPPGLVDVTGSVRTDAKERAQNVKLTLKAAGSRLTALVAGSIPPSSPAFHWSRRVEDPSLLAGYGLAAALTAEGIQFNGRPTAGGEDERNELAVHDSKPLAELLPELGKESDNFYAETLLKDLGARVKGAPASSENGAAAVLDYLREIEALEPGTRISNGSGLFDANRVSAHTLVSTLRSVYRDPRSSRVFVEQLAIGGVDGTLKHRFAAFKKTRAIRAKTGTLDQVIALSGYVFRPDGSSPVAFALIVSGISGKHAEVRKRMDDVVSSVARELSRDASPE